MKKMCAIIALLVLISFLPGLIGCTTTPTTTAPTITAPTGTAPTTAPGEVIKMKWADWDPPVSVYVRTCTIPWIKLIESETGGRVKIDYYGAQTLVKRPDLYDALIKHRSRPCQILHVRVYVISGGELNNNERDNRNEK